MDEEPRDSHTKQLYSMLRKSAKMFASGWCYAVIDMRQSATQDWAVQRIMDHMERALAMFSDMLGIEWRDDEVYTIEMDVREVCIDKLKPF